MSSSTSRSRAANFGGAPVRHGRLRQVGPVVTALRLVGIALAVVLVSTATVSAVAIHGAVSQIKPGIHIEHLAGATSAPPPGIGATDGEVNILVAGTDTRTGQSGMQTKDQLRGSSGIGNNDVTMLLHISSDHTNATVISFPRDLINVPICGGAISSAMFNTTLSRGLSCTVQTVEKMTGLTVGYAAVVTFDGVIGMSNAIGGVTVCLATPVKDRYTDPPLDLAAGAQTLVGPTALSFLRSRHGVGNGGDLGRISNQQVFLSALVRKITNDSVLKNPLTLYKLATAALTNLQTSDSMSNPTTLVALALTLKSIPLSNIVFIQYPSAAAPTDPNRVVPIMSAGNALMEALQSGKPLALSGALGAAAVADAAASTGSPSPAGPSETPPTESEAPEAAPVTLPPSITGQTAAQATCTKGL